MGLSDRDYERWDAGEGGPARRALRRMFGGGAGGRGPGGGGGGFGGNFFAWSVPLANVLGVRVRVHLLYVLFIVAELVTAIPRGTLGFAYIAMCMAALFVIVLLHEFGHIFACRAVGGEADDILMWPLGGLASCSPPNTWRANFITTAGGPLVNVALLPVFGGAVLAIGGAWGSVVFNPFDPLAALRMTEFTAYWQYFVWWLHYTNLILLLFNVCLPMFPLDGGRLAQALLWRRLGYRRSMEIAVNVGFIIAVMLGLFALVAQGATMLLGIAIFGGFVCWQEKRRLEFESGEWGMAGGGGGEGGYGWRGRGGDADESGSRRSVREEERLYRAAAKRQEAEAKAQAEVDRVLAKIASSGMGSLTRRERATLEAETQRKRRG